jgi:hypothetical protein
MVVSAPAPRGGRTNSPHLSKQHLSAGRARLLELMQSINFGRIENLLVNSCEPVFDPRPVIIREIKFAGENGPRAELTAADFLLKQHVVELFAFFDGLQNGVIDVLEIKHGLPFRMIVTEVPA